MRIILRSLHCDLLALQQIVSGTALVESGCPLVVKFFIHFYSSTHSPTQSLLIKIYSRHVLWIQWTWALAQRSFGHWCKLIYSDQKLPTHIFRSAISYRVLLTMKHTSRYSINPAPLTPSAFSYGQRWFCALWLRTLYVLWHRPRYKILTPFLSAVIKWWLLPLQWVTFMISPCLAIPSTRRDV